MWRRRLVVLGLLALLGFGWFVIGFRSGRAWSLRHDEAAPCVIPSLVRMP